MTYSPTGTLQEPCINGFVATGVMPTLQQLDGNLGRNAFRARRISEVELGLSKDVSPSERIRVRLRADVFNVWNRAGIYLDFHKSPSLNEIAPPGYGLREKFNFLQSIRNLISVNWSVSVPMGHFINGLASKLDQTFRAAESTRELEMEFFLSRPPSGGRLRLKRMPT